jgi:hypothetical protein
MPPPIGLSRSMMGVVTWTGIFRVGFRGIKGPEGKDVVDGVLSGNKITDG